MTKKLTAALLALAVCLSLAACGAAQPQQPQAPALSFTDSTGRTVEFAGSVTKVAVSGPLAQIFVFALAPDELVGISSAWDESAAQYLDTAYYTLPVLGQLYGGKGELDLETLLAAAPDVVIDVGESKSGIAEDMDALTEQTGIPFVHIEATLATTGDAYRMLGALLGREAEAATLAAFCEKTLANAEALAASVPEKTSALCLLGDAGLNVIAKGSYHSEPIDLLCDNLAVVDEPSSKGAGNETDFEQLLLWDPEVILFQPGSVYDAVAEDPQWQLLSAIQSGRYYEVPFGPYNWLGFPPSVQRCLGLLWLGELLYPDAVAYDLQTEVTEFYRLFWHCELTGAQYAALTARALPVADAAA